jgi:hypothetical protein
VAQRPSFRVGYTRKPNLLGCPFGSDVFLVLFVTRSILHPRYVRLSKAISFEARNDTTFYQFVMDIAHGEAQISLKLARNALCKPALLTEKIFLLISSFRVVLSDMDVSDRE